MEKAASGLPLAGPYLLPQDARAQKMTFIPPAAQHFGVRNPSS